MYFEVSRTLRPFPWELLKKTPPGPLLLFGGGWMGGYSLCVIFDFVLLITG